MTATAIPPALQVKSISALTSCDKSAFIWRDTIDFYINFSWQKCLFSNRTSFLSKRFPFQRRPYLGLACWNKIAQSTTTIQEEKDSSYMRALRMHWHFLSNLKPQQTKDCKWWKTCWKKVKFLGESNFILFKNCSHRVDFGKRIQQQEILIDSAISSKGCCKQQWQQQICITTGETALV